MIVDLILRRSGQYLNMPCRLIIIAVASCFFTKRYSIIPAFQRRKSEFAGLAIFWNVFATRKFIKNRYTARSSTRMVKPCGKQSTRLYAKPPNLVRVLPEKHFQLD